MTTTTRKQKQIINRALKEAQATKRIARPMRHAYIIQYCGKIIRQVFSYTEHLALRQLEAEQDLVVRAEDIIARQRIGSSILLTLRNIED